MTASRQQCAQAEVFLTLYRQAVQTLKQSAVNNVDWRNYFNFRDKFVNMREKTSTEKLKQIIGSQNTSLKLKSIDVDTLKNIEYMRFNYYCFLKFMPGYQSFNGGSKQLISILKKANQSIQNQLEKYKKY